MRDLDVGHGAADPVSVLVVDDHAVVRAGVRLMLNAGSPDMHVVAEAGTVEQARQLLETTHVDVALVDVMLPDGDGIQLCRHMRQEHPTTACIVLTSYPATHLFLAATLAGASNYLSKHAEPDDLRRAVRTAARGERTLDHAAAVRALDALSRDSADHGLVGGLTDQERRVFTLVGQGLSNIQIAETMHLTEKTVKNYVSRMLHKLGMDRRTEAAILAARLAERGRHAPQRPQRLGDASAVR